MNILVGVLGVSLSVIFILIGFLLVAVGISDSIAGIIIAGVIFSAGGIAMMIISSKKIPKAGKKTIDRVDAFSRKAKATINTRTYKLIFYDGLPLIRGVKCKVISSPEKVVIEHRNTCFEIEKSRILSVSIEKNVEKYTQTYSSAGGALAGAMAFGVIGAAIGGRAKTKQFNINTKYIVVQYKDKNDNIANILFDYKGDQSFVWEFAKSPQGNVSATIEL